MTLVHGIKSSGSSCRYITGFIMPTYSQTTSILSSGCFLCAIIQLCKVTAFVISKTRVNRVLILVHGCVPVYRYQVYTAVLAQYTQVVGSRVWWRAVGGVGLTALHCELECLSGNNSTIEGSSLGPTQRRRGKIIRYHQAFMPRLASCRSDPY